MEIYEAFTAYLKAHPGLTALIGQRIFPDEIPQGTALPCVSYMEISDVPDHLYSGQDTLEHPIYQFTAYAATKNQARAVARQIQNALSDYSGLMSGIEVQKIELQNRVAALVKSTDGTSKTYTENLEYEIYIIRR